MLKKFNNFGLECKVSDSGIFTEIGSIPPKYHVLINNIDLISTTYLYEAVDVYYKHKEEIMATKKDAVAVEQSPSVQEIISDALRKTGREGIEDLIDYMVEIGFFEAPASGGNHLHKSGGLAEHSLNVMQTAEKIGVSLLGGAEYNKIHNSVVIVSLLHDLGKCGDHGKKLYVENILKSGKQSDAKPYKRNPDLLPIGHATRSLTQAWRFIDLTEEEEFAIRYHDGLYEKENFSVIGHETPLYMFLHWGDMWSSHVIEGDGSTEEE